MNRNIILLSAILISTSVDLMFTSLASANESFSTCIKSLDNVIGVRLDTAIEDCQEVYRNQFANESFSTCVKNLDNKIGVRVDTAIKQCQSVFIDDYLGESFSGCIKNLDRIRSISIKTAQTVCQTTLNRARGDFRPFIYLDNINYGQKSDFQVCLEAGYSFNRCQQVR